ncbi:MAG TPA: hypothetical protein VLB44_20805 [Kofleriaceae bacterium]|nr:hypothetical protein [Kofleriaceae bacterium]
MIGEDWFETELREKSTFASELRRIARRTKTRPFRVIIVAAVITAGIFYKMSTKPQMYEAGIVLVMREESLRTKDRKSIPVESLRDYVLTVLLPNKDLLGIVAKHDLFPLRKKLGDEFAIQSLWDAVDIQIWKNSFVEVEEGEEKNLGSAHIGITVTSGDPVLATQIAEELSAIIRTTAAEQQQKVSDEIKAEVDAFRKQLGDRADDVSEQISAKVPQIQKLKDTGRVSEANALEIEIGALVREQKNLNRQLSQTLSSSDAIADQITAAGLDMSIDVVDEQRPEPPHQRGFVQVLIFSVIAFGALFVSAFVFGAFDPRVHDGEDVERLGLPLLGHVPGFAGDHVGSLEARGAARSRVPSSRRWRSHR